MPQTCVRNVADRDLGADALFSLMKDRFERIYTIDPRSGMGAESPLGGDLDSHLARIEYREAGVKKRGYRYRK